VDTTCQLFATWLSEDAEVGHIEHIQRIGDQLAPFPLLAVNVSDNAIYVLHGVKEICSYIWHTSSE